MSLPRDSDSDRTALILQPGTQVFGRYTLTAILGEGGMGVVWRARDEKLEREVALKFLPDGVRRDPEAIRDLKRETRRCLELTHENIVRVYDFVEDNLAAAIAMEYVPGKSLSALKAARPSGCFDVADILPLVGQLCAALDYAHQRAGIVHRDLKPANLLMTADGMLKVVDFGIARSLQDTHTRQTADLRGTSGTLSFMGPQQLDGGKDEPAHDIYALGATLYDLLAGKAPFWRGDIMGQIRTVPPGPLAERRTELGNTGAPIPPEWEKAIFACLAKRVEDRPASARAVLALIEAGSTPSDKTVNIAATAPTPGHGEKPHAVPALHKSPEISGKTDSPAVAEPKPREDRPSKTQLPLYAALIVAALALVGAGGWYFGSHLPEQRRSEAEQVQRASAKQELQRLEAERHRVAKERADALAHEQANKEDREYAVAITLIDTLVNGSPTTLRQSTEAAVKAYLAKAPAKLKIEVEGKWAMRLAAWDAARLAQEEADAKAAEVTRLAAARGGLVINTTPEGAEVRVGGLPMERSPLTLKNQKLGKYAVLVRLPGYEEWKGEIEVKENVYSELNVPLVLSINAVRAAAEEAMKTRDWNNAVLLLQNALRVFPQEAELQVQLRVARESAHKETVQKALARGFDYEKSYQWQEARDVYNETLQLDPDHAEAKDGYTRVNTVIRALLQYNKYVEAAEQLANKADFQGAIRRFNEAMAVMPSYLVNNDRVQQLRVLLMAQNKPVEFTFQSDGNTWVQITNYRAPQKFKTLSIKILPGDYEVIGRRRGYRDVNMLLQVRNNVLVPPPVVTVVCKVALKEAAELKGIVKGVGTVDEAADKLAQERAYQQELTKWRVEETRSNNELAEEIARLTKEYMPKESGVLAVSGTATSSSASRNAENVVPVPSRPASALANKQSSPTLSGSWENSLGMKFVPVAGTAVLFCIWETRVQDFQAFVDETKRECPKPFFPQGPTHPAVMVSTDDATAFCTWLTQKERSAGRLGANQEYRLPTDAEWDAAVGKDEFPWGSQWPPPKGAGNYDNSFNVDEYEYTAPVGSFTANRYDIYDLGGNVWERVGDRSGGVRGASFSLSDRGRLASSYRDDDRGVRLSRYVGFRVVCVVGSPR